MMDLNLESFHLTLQSKYSFLLTLIDYFVMEFTAKLEPSNLSLTSSTR